MTKIESKVILKLVLAGEIAVPCSLQSALAGVMSCLGCLLVKLPVASGVDARVPAQREPVNRVRAGMQQH